MNNFIKPLAVIILLATVNIIFAQPEILDTPNDTTKPWHLKDYNNSNSLGVSLFKAMAYAEENGRKQNKIVVAIIDSGVDTSHYDLKNKLWTNEKEIPNNNIDDDNNGYIDDIHGWNFLGNIKGENVDGDRLEITRIYAKYQDEFEGKKKGEVAKNKRDSFAVWQEAKEKYYKNLNNYKGYKKNIEENLNYFKIANKILRKHFDKEDFSAEEVENINTDDARLNEAKTIYLYFNKRGATIKKIESQLKDINEILDKKYNLKYEPRTIIGDNVLDINDSIYGNNDIEAASPGHGTHVAGIVGADWSNEKGTHGIVQNVELMIIRVVPGGDERDKDVALAIKYAVKMGAKVINCSFGKDYSPNKKFVDEALKYADKNDVLIIKAAGNDALDIEKEPHFPSKYYSDSDDYMKNIITVGASTQNANKDVIAQFSNYGNESVDVFAPGYEILSTYPKSKIKSLSGTSMASPVATGVAALVWSYYPDLKAEDIKKIILSSAVKLNKVRVKHPESKLFKKKFKKYSTTGGVVNAYEAMKKAQKITM